MGRGTLQSIAVLSRVWKLKPTLPISRGCALRPTLQVFLGSKKFSIARAEARESQVKVNPGSVIGRVVLPLGRLVPRLVSFFWPHVHGRGGGE